MIWIGITLGQYVTILRILFFWDLSRKGVINYVFLGQEGV